MGVRRGREGETHFIYFVPDEDLDDGVGDVRL